jgi:cell division control protein 45
MYNIPKLFGLERGGDVRCFILDNHRPMHLANIHSRHNVVVLDNGTVDINGIPSDGSDLSDDSGDEDEEGDDDDDEVDDTVRRGKLGRALHH